MENKLLSLEYISKAVDANFCGYSTSMRLGRRRTHMSERNHEVIKSQQLLDEMAIEEIQNKSGVEDIVSIEGCID